MYEAADEKMIIHEEEADKLEKCPERAVYKAAFSGLHASEMLKREEFYMKNNKPIFRIKRMTVLCAAIALLICMMSAGAYAATDGETINPITAIKVYLNGEDISGAYEMSEDGSYSIDLGDGASLTYNSQLERENKQGNDSDDIEYRVDITTNNGEDDEVELEIRDIAD